MLRTFLALNFLFLLYTPIPCQAESNKPLVVTSFTIIADWTQILSGKDANVVSLVPFQSETHGYQLTVRNAQHLRQASLIIGTCPSQEPWLNDWIKANQRSDKVLWLYTDGLQNSHHVCGDDSHAWTSPSEVKKMTKLLAEYLAKLSPKINSYHAYNQYFKVICDVDEELKLLFSTLPKDRRNFISQHPNLRHFAEQYGLKLAGTILTNSSAESADPSAHHFAQLLSLIRKEQIKVIVSDFGQNDSIAHQLAKNSGIPPPLALSFEYLDARGDKNDSWVKMMLHNARMLHEALSK